MRATYSERQHRTYEALRLRLVDCYGAAAVYKSTHAELLARLTDLVYGSKEFARLNQTYRSMLHEVSRCYADHQHRHSLIWRLGPESGPFPEDGKDRWKEDGAPLSELARLPGKLYGAHYWRGSDRPFSEWKPIN